MGKTAARTRGVDARVRVLVAGIRGAGTLVVAVGILIAAGGGIIAGVNTSIALTCAVLCTGVGGIPAVLVCVAAVCLGGVVASTNGLPLWNRAGIRVNAGITARTVGAHEAAVGHRYMSAGIVGTNLRRALVAVIPAREGARIVAVVRVHDVVADEVLAVVDRRGVVVIRHPPWTAIHVRFTTPRPSLNIKGMLTDMRRTDVQRADRLVITITVFVATTRYWNVCALVGNALVCSARVGVVAIRVRLCFAAQGVPAVHRFTVPQHLVARIDGTVLPVVAHRTR